MKTCFKCKQTLPLVAFYAHPRMADGHLNKCIECTKQDVKRRYYSPDGRERVRRYEQERFRSEHRKHAIRLYQQARRLRSPEKYLARTAVGNAVRDGRLVRGACEVCGCPDTQAHHEDYFRPLDVQWLCFKHHREVAHGQIVG